MIKKLEIHHLRTLDALFKFGNISLAAEYLNVSQQAVSLQLKKIREILGDHLFVRSGHGMVPTNYARLIEPRLQNILMLLNEIPLPDSIDLAKIDRTLVISATDYTQTIILADLIGDLRNYMPQLKVLVSNIESAQLTKKMHHGEIDLAFTSEGYVPEGLISEPLFTEKYLCVTAYQGVAQDTPMSIANLAASFDFLVTCPGVASLKGSADAWFELQGLRRSVVVSAPSFFIAMECLKKSNMIGFIPSRLLPCAGLYEVILEKYPPGYEVVAAFHPGAKNDPLITWILDRIKRRFSESID
ncbi:LysR family transcriptional regulator [Microbulbifer epialgicus]|uniref:LysR family transcriptional regulator n=1 Tax=Microbulbifer epialgicus TaxID=393907 RepID=A0ABV4P4Z4_9GAMM